MINKIKKIAYIFRHKDNPLRRLLGILFMRLPFDIGNLLYIKIQVQDYYIRLHASAISIAFWINPNDRIADYSFLTAYLKPNDVYMDVGANIGTTLIPAAKAVQGGRVIGFEPNPRIFSFLKENVTLNHLAERVELHNSAVGSERGSIGFSSKMYDDLNGVVLDEGDIKVPVVLLDDITEPYSRITLIKIDVEGYEKFVIDGGMKTLAKADCVYFELSGEQYHKYGYSINDVLLKLENLGFLIFISNTFQRLERIGSESDFNTIHVDAFGIKDIHDFKNRTGWQFQNSTDDDSKKG